MKSIVVRMKEVAARTLGIFRKPSRDFDSNTGLPRSVLALTDKPGTWSAILASTDPQWNCKTAVSIEQALLLPDLPDIPVILVDGDVPHLPWRKAISTFANLPYRQCVILVSLASDHYLWEEVTGLGGYDVIRKPISHPQLERVLQSGWAYARSQRRLDQIRRP